MKLRSFLSFIKFASLLLILGVAQSFASTIDGYWDCSQAGINNEGVQLTNLQKSCGSIYMQTRVLPGATQSCGPGTPVINTTENYVKIALTVTVEACGAVVGSCGGLWTSYGCLWVPPQCKEGFSGSPPNCSCAPPNELITTVEGETVCKAPCSAGEVRDNYGNCLVCSPPNEMLSLNFLPSACTAPCDEGYTRHPQTNVCTLDEGRSCNEGEIQCQDNCVCRSPLFPVSGPMVIVIGDNSSSSCGLEYIYCQSSPVPPGDGDGGTPEILFDGDFPGAENVDCSLGSDGVLTCTNTKDGTTRQTDPPVRDGCIMDENGRFFCSDSNGQDSPYPCILDSNGNYYCRDSLDGLNNPPASSDACFKRSDGSIYCRHHSDGVDKNSPLPPNCVRDELTGNTFCVSGSTTSSTSTNTATQTTTYRDSSGNITGTSESVTELKLEGQCGGPGQPACKIDVGAYDVSKLPTQDGSKRTVETHGTSKLDSVYSGLEGKLNEAKSCSGASCPAHLGDSTVIGNYNIASVWGLLTKPSKACSPLTITINGNQYSYNYCDKFEPIRQWLAIFFYLATVIRIYSILFHNSTPTPVADPLGRSGK